MLDHIVIMKGAARVTCILKKKKKTPGSLVLKNTALGQQHPNTKSSILTEANEKLKAIERARESEDVSFVSSF